MLLKLVSTRVLPHYKSYKLFISYLSSHTHKNLKKLYQKEFVEQQKQSTWTAWVQGWGYVLSNRIILSTMIFVTIAMAVLQLVDSQFPTLFRAYSHMIK